MTDLDAEQWRRLVDRTEPATYAEVALSLADDLDVTDEQGYAAVDEALADGVLVEDDDGAYGRLRVAGEGGNSGVTAEDSPEEPDSPRSTPTPDGPKTGSPTDVAGGWSEVDFTSPEPGVYPATWSEREQWMCHTPGDKKPFAPWADRDHPDADAEDDARWKHLRRVALAVTDRRVPPPTAPRVTEHREPVAQGGARYYRCEGCGREWIHEELRRRGCPVCTGRRDVDDTDEATEADTEQRHEVATDGGRHRLTEGAIVVDEDSDDGDKDLLEVVEVYRDERADDWYISAIDATVADANPNYPASDDVVVCVYREDVLGRLGEGAPAEWVQSAAARDEIRTYTFPRSRLRPVGGDDE